MKLTAVNVNYGCVHMRKILQDTTVSYMCQVFTRTKNLAQVKSDPDLLAPTLGGGSARFNRARGKGWSEGRVGVEM